MKRVTHIAILFILMLLMPVLFACTREIMETEVPEGGGLVPEGMPVTMIIPFASTELYEVEVGTRYEATSVDEARIHDLYVLIFDDGNTTSGSARKIYGHYFSFDHLKNSLTELENDMNECWYVKNKAIGDTDAVKTEGAVKISTISCSDATLVVIANVSNSITSLNGNDALDELKAVQDLNELQSLQVCLEQDVVNRKDLFLMTGKLDHGPDPSTGVDGPLHTGNMIWGTLPSNYNSNFRVLLTPVDAKVKFRVRVNNDYISEARPVYWQVINTPDRCYLDSDYNGRKAPDEIKYFESQQYYFENKEIEGGYTWYTFCFYMLENREEPNASATDYYQRELQEKIDSGDSGYDGPTGPDSESFSNHYVENGDWRFAPTFGTYVKFDLVLTLTEAGIENIGSEDPQGMHITQALTSDAIFTVHLGDFGNSEGTGTYDFDEYYTERGNFYTYNVTVNNTKSIYTEVERDREDQSGQEGFLLLTDTEIINADCHYEYHQIEFPFRPDMSQDQFSWYVKTPFGEGEPDIIKTPNGDGTFNYSYDARDLDYLWVKFGVNQKVMSDPGSSDPDPKPWTDRENGDVTVNPYTKHRHDYPGDSHYDPTWRPGQKVAAGVPCKYDANRDVPDLMDITQLIEYIFTETEKEDKTGVSDFIADAASLKASPVIRVTAFINEFYYESDPTKPGFSADPDLWRRFVNANPRELHILSDARLSRDRKSDVILSSHSIIQQSIQTIYNIYANDLSTLWGAEHRDEMREKTEGWPYWPQGLGDKRSGDYDTRVGRENGRLNSAYIWDFYSSKAAGGTPKTGVAYNKKWETYLNYNVHNDVPELLETYHGMAWSCLTRNRDNNGDGYVDSDEIRWYLASADQLVGMWVGNESLSIDTRLYRPADGQWRAHIISSSGERVSWAEEGGGATKYVWDYENGRWTWPSQVEASKGESVRCLRNIGTWSDPDDGGALKDISFAPFDTEVQRYFTITRESSTGAPDDPPSESDAADTRYILHFDRINPKSLRELSLGELPYHDQFNVANCVYLKFETQSREDEDLLAPGDNDPYKEHAYPFDVRMDAINPEITLLGYNPYCPPGYRFPNHSELILMSLYLPDKYFDSGSNGDPYASEARIPSRTYYDRGLFGKNTSGFEYEPSWSSSDPMADPVYREQGKVGWSYTSGDHKPHCVRKEVKQNRSRCVRDINMTGTIEGGLLMKDVLYPGDDAPISFSFYSSGSTFISAALKLCFTNGSGVYHERDIPVQTTPSGLQFLADQTLEIPSLSSMGFASQDVLDNNGGALRNMKLKATLRNAYASQTFVQPFTLGNPLTGSISLSEGDAIFPADDASLVFDFSSLANTCQLASISIDMYGDDPDNGTVSFPSFVVSGLACHTTRPLAIPSLSTMSSTIGGVSQLGDNVTFRATVTDEGGSTYTATLQVPLASHLTGGVEFPDSFDADKGVAIRPGVVAATSSAWIIAESLWWRAGNSGSFTEIALDATALSHLNAKEWEYVDVWLKDMIGASAFSSKAYKNTEYQFYCTATCNDGTSITTPVRSMTIIRLNENDNPGPWTSSNTVSQIKNKWNVQTISGLDFSRGDYLEADIDVTNCVYIRKDGSSGNDIGMDNLISIGTHDSTLLWRTGKSTILFYYPAHNPTEAPGQDRLQVAIINTGNKVARFRPFDLSGSLKIKLSEDQMLINETEIDYTDDKGGNNSDVSHSETNSLSAIYDITHDSGIAVGSVEGNHRSRATYRYVRVIRERTDITP